MQKPAATQYPVHELIRERWSPRAFSEEAVSPEILRSLFEAARWAPSCNNEQPWAFLVGTRGEGDTFKKILGTLMEANQTWARHAPVLAIAVSELAFAKNGHSNRNAFYDTGAAVSQLTTEATSRGLARPPNGRIRSPKGHGNFRNSEWLGANCDVRRRLCGRPTNTSRRVARARVGAPDAQAFARICHERAMGPRRALCAEIIKTENSRHHAGHAPPVART